MSFSPGAADFMKQLTYDSCSRPFWVFAATGSAAFLELWFTLAFLDLEDLVRSRGFSQSNRDLKKGRRGRRHGGLRLPRGNKGSVIRYSALGTRTLLIVTLPLEVIGFAMLIYFGTDKFFYRWSSLLENIRCEGEPRTLIRSDQNFGVVPNLNGGAVGLSDLDQNAGVLSSNAFGAAVAFGIYEVHLAIEVEGKRPITPTDYQAGIDTVGALNPVQILGTAVSIGRGRGGTLMVSATVVMPLFTGGSIGWVIVGPSVAAGLSIISAHVIVHQKGG